jgi:hypothetical protein
VTTEPNLQVKKGGNYKKYGYSRKFFVFIFRPRLRQAERAEHLVQHLECDWLDHAGLLYQWLPWFRMKYIRTIRPRPPQRRAACRLVTTCP